MADKERRTVDHGSKHEKKRKKKTLGNGFKIYLRKKKKLPKEQTYSKRSFPYSLHYAIAQFGLAVSLQDRELIWGVGVNNGTY